MRNLIVIVALAVAASAAGAQVTVDPGMSREAVVHRLGKPVSERTTGGQTFLFYANGCEKKCGMNDLVVLENDAVVDAIFRSPKRQYTGQSSSPRGATPVRSRPTEARASAAPATPRGNLVIGGDAPRGKSASGARQADAAAGDTSSRGNAATSNAASSAASNRAQSSRSQTIQASTGQQSSSPGNGGTSVLPRYQAGAPAPTAGANQAVTPTPPRAGSFNAGANDSTANRAHSPMFVSPNPGTPQVPMPDSTSSPATPITPGQRPAPFVGSRPNPTDSARMAQQKRQQPDSTKPPED